MSKIKQRNNHILQYNGNKRISYIIPHKYDLGGTLNSAMPIIGNGITLYQNYKNLTKLKDTTDIESNIKDAAKETFTQNATTNSLLNSWNNINWLKDDYDYKDVYDVNGWDIAANGISSVLAGAGIGGQVQGYIPTKSSKASAAGASGSSTSGADASEVGASGAGASGAGASGAGASGAGASGAGASGASGGTSGVLGMLGPIVGGLGGAALTVLGAIDGKRKAKQKAEELNNAAKQANIDIVKNYEIAVDKLNNEVARNSMKTVYSQKDGGEIHINPKNKGKFTDSARRHGMSVQDFANFVMAHRDRFSPLQIKRANFARNAAKWQHADGGTLNSSPMTNGGYFSNGLSKVESGGEHDKNPIGGVLLGYDESGVPDLVEEGEVIYNNYVFSNRLSPDKKLLKALTFPKQYGKMSFAKIAEKIGDESKERPTDPISQRGLQANMQKLELLQEITKLQNFIKNKGNNKTNTFAYGGDMDDTVRPAAVTTGAKSMPTISWPGVQTSGPVLHDKPYTPDKPYTTTGANTNNGLNTDLRYAPVWGSALGALQSVFSKPDYSNPDMLIREANNIPRVSVRPTLLSNRMRYNPIDESRTQNAILANSGATRRTITNTAANPGTALSALINTNYGTGLSLGQALQSAREYNDKNRKEVTDFNRATDQYNSQAALQADSTNAELALKRSDLRRELLTQAVAAREQIKQRHEDIVGNNLSNFFDNIGGVGKENFIFNMIKSNPALLYDYINNNGTIGYKK